MTKESIKRTLRHGQAGHREREKPARVAPVVSLEHPERHAVTIGLCPASAGGINTAPNRRHLRESPRTRAQVLSIRRRENRKKSREYTAPRRQNMRTFARSARTVDADLLDNSIVNRHLEGHWRQWLDTAAVPESDAFVE